MTEATKKRPRANGRRKGHDFERHIAAALRPIWPEARRGAQSRSGKDAPDVDGTPFWIECKRGARPSITAACRQALAATDGRPVVVVIKDDRKPAFVLEWVEHTEIDDLTGVVTPRYVRQVDLDETGTLLMELDDDHWLALSFGAWLAAFKHGGEE